MDRGPSRVGKRGCAPPRKGHPRCAVAVFAKPPVAGAVKTRLARALGPERAAALAQAFLLDTWASLGGLPGVAPFLATTGPLVADLADVFGPRVLPQGDGDLGERIERVLRGLLGSFPAALAVGADSPGLPRERVDEAVGLLTRCDAVLGPCADGGFYLLGLRRCPRGLLRDLPWSSRETAAQTAARLRGRGLTLSCLAPWFDVDEAEDLDRLRGLLRSEPGCAPRTARLLLDEGAAPGGLA